MGRPLTRCPGCGVELPAVDGPTHRYIGASPACWAIYSALNVGEPPLAPGPYNGLLVDAYAAQHPGTPSNQAIQSVAVHLLSLYAVPSRARSADAPSPDRRTALAQSYVTAVWETWVAQHAPTVAEWYRRYVLPERI